MTKELAPAVQLTAEEKALLLNDLSKLQPEQRASLYLKVCQSVGLNPLTQPFSYINLNGKLTLYAQRNCTDQLRSINNVSVTISSRSKIDDLYVVTAKATLPNGRVDESIGAVALGPLKGEALANALMKGETKAKRRVTLSICGLSFMDETEAETIKDAKFVPLTETEQKILESGETNYDPSDAHCLPPDDTLDQVLSENPQEHFDNPPIESFDEMPSFDEPTAYKIPFPGIYHGKTLQEIPLVQLKAYTEHVKKQKNLSPEIKKWVAEFLDKVKPILSATR